MSIALLQVLCQDISEKLMPFLLTMNIVIAVSLLVERLYWLGKSEAADHAEIESVVAFIGLGRGAKGPAVIDFCGQVVSQFD